MFPTKEQLLKNFFSCMTWEEKYLYIIDLGKLLPRFPEDFRTQQYLVSGCQSRTWITITNYSHYNSSNNDFLDFYGDSDSTIIKGVITIIFSLYQNLNIKSIVKLDVYNFLNQLKLNQHVTITRVQGIYSIINTIKMQINNIIP
ncbi:SufE protein probably involved in Fe-S center assembly [Candidatus Blochmanniella floridana]|uniref:SufE protein probably involved in Fe-S center assembly n=1 Tax=Blochmanniella floridana TaxID=203907 RepID=Q7VR59_BLOFL|nr:SufE protein probably involved in Fe-S center assembly [Candidatus Blochmannia floridanus]